MKKHRIISRFAACMSAAAACFCMWCASASAFFPDIPENMWYTGYVKEAAAKGWFNGDDKGLYKPESNTTRAQAAKVLFSYMYGDTMPSVNSGSYSDVDPYVWYARYADLNKVYDIIPAYGDYFEPEVYITRRDVVIAIINATGMDTYRADLSYLNQFDDRQSIPSEYLEAIAAAVQHGLLSGYSDGRLNLNAPVTRAQFAAFMSRGSRLVWEQGSIDNEGVPYDAENRIRTDYFYTPSCTVSGDNMNIAFIHYSDDGALELTYDSGWLEGEIYLPEGWYRLVASYKNEGAIASDAGSKISFDYNPAVSRDEVLSVFRTVAHQGGAFGAPQNSISEFSLAADRGYTYVECDVRWTKDNVPMIMHDAVIPFDNRPKLCDITYAQAKSYKIGSRSGNYPKERYASFEELMALCKKRRIHPYVEIYDGESFTAARAKQLIDIARKYNMEYRITWISSYFDALKTIKTVSNMPDLRMLYVVSKKDYSLKWKLAELKNSTNRVGLDVNYQYLDSSFIKEMKRCGFAVECWTVDDANTAAKMISMGVTGLTTNTLSPR